MSRKQVEVQNRLLAALSDDDFRRLEPHLTERDVGLGEVLIEANQPIRHVYFPEIGLASFVSPTEVETEVGLVGREGFVGASVTLDVDSMPLKAAGQIAGRGYTIPTDALRAASIGSQSLRSLLARYTHVFMMQAASTAYANAHFTVEQRLARWLLMTHDRVDGDDLALTHDFLAVMLCVRRPGVTVATHVLEGNHAIRARRGRITILDRQKLIELAGDSYGLAEAEYERVMEPKIQKSDLAALV